MAPSPAPAAADPAVTLTVLLAEFAELKSEQRARIATRDGAFGATIVAVAGVAYAALQGRPELLLAVPFIGFVLGWMALTNDIKVTAAHQYARDVLGPRLAALGAVEPLGWETFKSGDGRTSSRSLMWLLVNAVVFVASGWVALGFAVSTTTAATAVAQVALGLGVLGGVVVGCVFVVQLLMYADVPFMVFRRRVPGEAEPS